MHITEADAMQGVGGGGLSLTHMNIGPRRFIYLVNRYSMTMQTSLKGRSVCIPYFRFSYIFRYN